MSTLAVKFLQERKVPFKVIKYQHEEKGAEFASKATGFALEQTIKTLVADLGDHKYCLALLPGNRQLDPKALARALGVKRTAMAETATAEKLTGYLVGGISPFGTRKSLPIVMETSIAGYEIIHINAGQRGMMLEMDPSDIIRLMKCKVAEIAK